MIPGPNRRGFTLVELLVVMALIMMLFGLGVAFLPGVYQNKEVSRGAELFQSWLVTARQRAKRDKVPYGIRILPITAPATLADKCQFVVRPETLTGGTLTANGNTFAVAGGPAMTGVMAGDTLEVNGGVPHLIGAGLVLYGPGPTAFPTNLVTKDYRIIRQARPLQGETLLEMPNNVGIDLAQCSKNGQSANVLAAPFDIVFSPAGNLTGPAAASPRLIFYIRTSTVGAAQLVTIYTRTGLIAVHPVDQTQFGNPYNYTNDPRSTGM